MINDAAAILGSTDNVTASDGSTAQLASTSLNLRQSAP
jgi:hypothetical protein